MEVIARKFILAIVAVSLWTLFSIEKLKDYLNNNADEVETRYREVRIIRLIDSSITIETERGKL